MPQNLTFQPCKVFRGAIRPPSDKSLTHRAYMLAAIAENGVSVVYEPLNGEDCESTLSCLRKLGATIDRVSDREVRIGAIQKWNKEPLVLDCGNSGTTMRLLSGIIASQPGLNAQLIGDESLSQRPMARISEPLNLMGAKVTGERPPVSIIGQSLTGISYRSPVASAQIKSAILLAALNSSGTTHFIEPFLSRDHTERMLKSLGVHLYHQGDAIYLEGGQKPRSFEFTVPGDVSSAAFFIVGALLKKGSHITLRNVGLNSTRTGILDILTQMGIQYELSGESMELGEPMANVSVKAPITLNPFIIEGDIVPRLIDEIPILAVLATQCYGTSIIKNAQELRVKETDRIKVVSENLLKMGANVEPTDDGMIIKGPTPLIGRSVDSAGDHRIGMSFAIASSVAQGETVIESADSINTSYPQFIEHYKELTASSEGGLS